MDSSDLAALSSRARAIFQEQLLALGFTHVNPNTFSGEVAWRDVDGQVRSTRVDIEVTDDFPYRCPRVRPATTPGPAWHLDRDKAMCLYTSGEEAADLPWRDPSTLLARVAAWLQSCANEWKDEPADLDLERYLRTTTGLFLYENATIAAAIGKGVRLRRKRP
jgi:hypothetical protein